MDLLTQPLQSVNLTHIAADVMGLPEADSLLLFPPDFSPEQ